MSARTVVSVELIHKVAAKIAKDEGINPDGVEINIRRKLMRSGAQIVTQKKK